MGSEGGDSHFLRDSILFLDIPGDFGETFLLSMVAFLNISL